MNYQEALSWLYSLQRFGIKLGLENIRRLLAALPAPAKHSRVIHVAGTNGKGSVCAMMDSILRTKGCRTGLFTSPHLITFRERIQIDGQLISEEDVAAGLTRIHAIVHAWNPHPTFFEITTALAVDAFARAGVENVILETGMGGRLDATNAVLSNVSVITPIAFDHQKWLGDTLGQIASEKAGIIKPNVPVVSAEQQLDAMHIIQAQARHCQASLQFVRDSYDQSPVGLRGTHQKQNAALAIAALAAAGLDIDDATIARGLASVEWPARFQAWDQNTIIDGAHNTAAARVLTATWREVFGNERATLILAVLSDKDVLGICEALRPIADRVLAPKIRSERALAPEQLARTVSRVDARLPCLITPSIEEALKMARTKPNRILMTGSLRFAGEALACVQGKPASFEECTQ